MGIPIALSIWPECVCGSTLHVGVVGASVTCRACDAVRALPLDTWRAWIEDAALDGPDLPDDLKLQPERDGTRFEIERAEVACAACGTPIPVARIEAALGDATCACTRPGCTGVVAIRPVPPELAAAFPAVTHLVGEVDDAPPFYLWHDPAQADRRRPRFNAFWWHYLHALAVDDDNNVYVVTDAMTVACLDRAGRTRWVHVGLPLDKVLRVAVARDALLVWSPHVAAITRLALADGALLPPLGGEQPAHATRHHLDLRECKSLAVDPTDDTIVVLKEERIVRCSGVDGTGVATWPSHKGGFLGRKTIEETLRPFGTTKPDGHDITRLADHPLDLSYGELTIDRAGNLYVTTDRDLACFDRAGKRAFTAKLVDNRGRTFVDASGRVYYATDANRVAKIWRQPPGGGDAICLVDGTRPETAIADNYQVAVSADGTIVIACSSERDLRTFAPF